MLYAVVGIPLTLLTITNLGGFMATVFRWFYKNVISGVCCCTHCDAPSSEAKRRKVAAAAAVAAVQATKTVKTVGRKVARSYASWPPTAEETVANAATDTFSSQASNHSSSSRESSVSTVRRHFTKPDFELKLHVQGGPENVPTCFCQKLRQISIKFDIFGTQMAKTIELCEVIHSLFTSPDLCQRTTV